MKYLIALFISVIAFPAFAADAVEGLWLTENKRAVIQLEECETSLCGYIYWITEGGLKFDENNPDETKRGDKLCGMRILWGFEKDDINKWAGGKIYKADDGDIYSANVKLKGDGTLKLRGYVGAPLLGKTQIWTRADKADYKACS